jgi:hypothetical protein
VTPYLSEPVSKFVGMNDWSVGYDSDLGCSPPCGPKAGSWVVVRASDPPGAYSLPRGLKAGDIVVLLNFDRGWWDVRLAENAEDFRINLLNVGEVLSIPTRVEVPRASGRPNWREIIEVARQAQQELRECNKPGQRMRQAYFSTFVRARALGYHGTEDDWETFVRRRGNCRSPQ